MYNKEKIFKIISDIYTEADTIAPYVVIAQPRRDKSETPAQKFDGYDGIHVDLLGFSHGYVDISGQKVDVARNYLIERALESGAEYLFFIGEDTVVPFDAFKILLETSQKNPNAVVAGVYYIKASDAMIMTKTHNWITVPNVDPGQLIEAWQTGMDCMLIPIRILQQLKTADPDLPFCCIYNDGKSPFIGEDNFFVHRLRKAGVKLLVNTDVQCLHIDLANGKYTAHPDVDLKKFFTNIKITEPFTLHDKLYLEKRWIDRLPDPNKKTLDSLIQELSAQNKPIKLNMGSGEDSDPDFIHIDSHNPKANIKSDVFDLKLTANSLDVVQAIHFIEHIPHYRVFELLNAWLDALKPGGELIMELPDLQALCSEYPHKSHQEKHDIAMCIYGISANSAHSPHLWGYDPQIMTDILTQVGYQNIEVQESTQNHPGINFRITAKK